MSQQAHRAAMAVIRYVYQGNEPHTDLDFGSHGEFYVYRSHDLGLEQSFALLIGLRKSNTAGMSGAVMQFEGDTLLGYHMGVAIYCMQQLNLADLRRSVNSTGFMKTFEHEYLHLLDNARTENRIIAGPRSDPRVNPAAYYNDPAETNAYFHDIAKDMMAVINAGPEAADYFELYHFTGDWQTDLARLLTKDHYVRRFVQSLRKQQRRALLRRLYRLYQQMMQTVHRPVA